ncbi:SDR family NAD(P)-dependent oxidoreductase [Jiangella gansuensis]|uniref:SDR family NAD(P)-dependent oxidoreductase n=1 Tax=Jiangella gansuensis TaxID=281473 RepID=UPI001B7FD44A|nr:SDR family NAD(P)-dependent oxidoreductase [Jiangella gansuensis]
MVFGAGAGIGRAVAVALAVDGATVICSDINARAARETAELICGSVDAAAVTADVADQGAVEAAVTEAAERSGQVHVVVNCVGITGTTGMPSHEYDLAEFDRVYRVNLRGALVVSQVAVRHMLGHGYGRVVHFASIAGKEGNPNMIGYSATKAGLIGMVKAQGKEYAGTGITVNAIAPAVIHTDLVDALPDEVVDYMVAKIPMGRTGTLEEAAALATFIASPACGFTTGFTFDLSGGRATY